jgi:hypothetical protein
MLTPLMASMIWGRLVSWNNFTVEHSESLGTYYEKEGSDVITEYTSRTLKRSRYFILVLAIQPGIVILATFSMWFLYGIPIARGFGIISVLAGFQEGESNLLKGASLSGKLSRPVKMSFYLKARRSPKDYDSIGIRLGSETNKGVVIRHIKYS